MIDIRRDIDGISEMASSASLVEPTLKRAAVSALNKTATSVRTHAVREVAKEYNVKQKDIREKLLIAKADFENLKANISGRGSPGIPLFKFSPTPKRAPSTRRLASGGYSPKGGIKIMIHKGSRKMVKSAFVARMATGHVGVFRRREGMSTNGKIEELYGPSPLLILLSQRYENMISAFAENELDKNLYHETDFS